MGEILVRQAQPARILRRPLLQRRRRHGRRPRMGDERPGQFLFAATSGEPVAPETWLPLQQQVPVVTGSTTSATFSAIRLFPAMTKHQPHRTSPNTIALKYTPTMDTRTTTAELLQLKPLLSVLYCLCY